MFFLDGLHEDVNRKPPKNAVNNVFPEPVATGIEVCDGGFPQQTMGFFLLKMDVSANRHTPKSSILIGFSIINHPFWGTPIFGDTQMIILGCEMRYHHLRKHPHSWQTSFPQANIAHENRPLPTGTCHFPTINVLAKSIFLGR